MSITKRFIYLASIGLLFLIIGAIINNSFTIFIIYNLICIGLLIVDYSITSNEADIDIRRCGSDKLSIYEKEAICFEVYNKSSRKIYIELKDEIPLFHFKTENKIMEGTVLPHEKREFKYYVVPSKRGAFQFGSLYVKYEGKLKLCTKIFKVKLTRDYKVYPNMKNLRKYRLSLCNNRQFKEGQKNLKILGRGTAFESLREYVQGDEYRKINWQATARVNKLIINQYEPEKNQHVHILIDTGRPMSHTIRGNRKLDMVVNTALVLSDIVNQNGDQSGLMIFNTEVKNVIIPGKGSEHRNKMLEALYHIDHNNETSNYDDAFFYLKRKERHRSIVFLFTDFDTVEEAENMLKVLPTISRNNLVAIILIKDEKLEGISEQSIKNNVDLFNKGVALELIDERKRIVNLLNKRGVFCIECPAEKIEYTAVNKYIQIKNRTYI